MSFNDILVETGGFGLYQKLLVFGTLAYSLVLVSITYWVQVFILLTPPHRCKVFPNDTEWFTFFNESDTQEIDRCHMTHENGTLLGCNHGMIYDFSVNYPTYTSEHDLVCENSWKMYISHTSFWIGSIFGNILFGAINDKYGRRRAYQCAVTMAFLADVSTYFCKNHIPFVIARFFSATGDGSIATIAFVLAIEHCIPSKRRLTIFVWSFAYALTSFSMAWLIYALFDWKYILMCGWVPSAGAIIMSFFLPESSSWLLTKGRIDEAIEYIQRMGRVNSKPISRENILRHLQINDGIKQEDPNTVKTMISSSNEKAALENKKTTMTFYKTFMMVVKLPNLRKRILLLGFLWLASCSCYHGNSLEFQSLPFNMYITYSIGALIEVPGTLFVIFTLDKFGRRWTNAGFFIIGGIFGILGKIVDSETVMIILVMAMRCCYASAYDITFSLSSELIPTEIRGRTISFIRTCGGLGASLAPFIVSLAQEDPLLPLALFGIIAIIAGLLMLMLPETTHQHLPQTLEDGENFGLKQRFWFCPFVQGHPEKGSEDLNEKSTFGPLANPAFETDEEQVKCIRIQELPKY